MVSSCPTCQLNNPQGARRLQPVQWCGAYPGEDWQMDFTQMPVSQGYKYLLVMIDTFTGWIEGFPTQTEKAEVKWSRSVVSDSSQPHELQPTRFHHPWYFPGKNTGVGCHFFSRGIFPTQGSKLSILLWQVDSLPLSHLGSSNMLYTYHQNKMIGFVCSPKIYVVTESFI